LGPGDRKGGGGKGGGNGRFGLLMEWLQVKMRRERMCFSRPALYGKEILKLKKIILESKRAFRAEKTNKEKMFASVGGRALKLEKSGGELA